MDDPAEPAEPADRHTRWQKFVRAVFHVLGPAQAGLPPYPTARERAAWQRANAPLPPPEPAEKLVPPGYQIKVYTDTAGVEHRSLVRDDSTAAPE